MFVGQACSRSPLQAEVLQQGAQIQLEQTSSLSDSELSPQKEADARQQAQGILGEAIQAAEQVQIFRHQVKSFQQVRQDFDTLMSAWYST